MKKKDNPDPIVRPKFKKRKKLRPQKQLGDLLKSKRHITADDVAGLLDEDQIS
jgi:hypothetical protein